MKRRVSMLSVLALSLIVFSAPSKAPAPGAKAPLHDAQVVFCVNGSSPKPCSVMPHDVIEGFGYGSTDMKPETQDDFDNFSWQSFVALNWPAFPSGDPNPQLPLTSPGPKVWDYFKQADEVFLPGGATPDKNYPSKTYPPPPPACVANNPLLKGERVLQMSSKINDVANIVSSFEEAAVNVPLIDSAGNFIIYDVMMNKDEFEYIAVRNAYYNSNNQKNANISFPPGDSNTPKVGAIELKTAWKIMTARDDKSTYIVRPMRIYVPKEHSSTGKAFCTGTLPMGLIGMHIIHKGANQPDWIWSTFEHVNNAPLSSTPLPAVAKTPAGPCKPPTSASLMSLYNPGCTTCTINNPPVQPNQPFYFATSQPYASKYLVNGKYGTQVVRCSRIYDEPKATQWLNTQWQAALPKPLSSYMLIGSQWQALETLVAGAKKNHAPSATLNKGVANGGQQLRGGRLSGGIVPAPPYLQNTAAETYLQNASPLSASYGVGSCLGCHTGAQGAACEDADFSFMLSRAQPTQQCQQASRARMLSLMGHPSPPKH